MQRRYLTNDKNPPYNVRLAQPSDEGALYDLLMSLERDNNSFGFAADEERIREHIRLGTEKKGGAHGIVDGNGCIAGSIGIIPDRWWFSAAWSLAVIWLHVRPEYRKSTYADDLCAWGEWFRASMEAGSGQQVRLVSAVVSRNRLPVKLRFWRKKYGEMIGGIFEIG
jgi:hypothetical protein